MGSGLCVLSEWVSYRAGCCGGEEDDRYKGR